MFAETQAQRSEGRITRPTYAHQRSAVASEMPRQRAASGADRTGKEAQLHQFRPWPAPRQRSGLERRRAPAVRPAIAYAVIIVKCTRRLPPPCGLPACGGGIHEDFAASPQQRQRRSGRDGPNVALAHRRPGADRLREQEQSLVASAPASPEPDAGQPTGAARRIPAGAVGPLHGDRRHRSAFNR